MQTPLPAASAADATNRNGPASEMTPVALVASLFSRHFWSIAAFAASGAMVGAMATQAGTPMYRATATLLIEGDNLRQMNLQDAYTPAMQDGAVYFATQLELMRSRELAVRVVRDLKLDSDPLLKPKPASGLDKLLQQIGVKEEAKASSPASRQQALAEAVQYGLQVQGVEGTQLVRVSFVTPFPQYAAAVANAAGSAYLDLGLESRLNATQKASQWLTDRLDQIRSKLEDSEANLQRFREQNRIVSVGGGTRGLVDAEVLENSERLREAQRIKAQLGNTYQRIQAAGESMSNLESVSPLLVEAGVASAQTGYLSAQEEVRQLSERYGQNHPSMATAKAKLEANRNAFHEQLRVAAGGVKTRYEIAAQTERQMLGAVDAAKGRAQQMDRLQYELGVLERETDSNRELYEMFLTRFKQTDSTVSFDAPPARIVEQARRPDLPYSPVLWKGILKGALLGLLLGIAAAALRRALGQRLESAEQLEQLLGRPVMGVLPSVSRAQKRSLTKHFVLEPNSPFSETLRGIRASLLLSEAAGSCRRLAITSALAGEGKSSVSAGIAAALSSRERVLLLEADLRAPHLVRSLGLDTQRPGISEALAGTASLDDCIHKGGAGMPDVLAVAKRPPNPGEVVESAAFKNLLDTLQARYDRIVIDTPPCRIAGDALVLSRLADGVLLVVNAERGDTQSVQASLRQLAFVNARLIGAVLNEASHRRQNVYYGSYGYYGSAQKA